MLNWAIAFSVTAALAGALAYSGLSPELASFGKLVFTISVMMAVVTYLVTAAEKMASPGETAA